MSCVVEDSTGIKYYAKLADTASGTAKINIPKNMPVGSYTIKLFNEECNADNYIDFASALISIRLTVQVPTAPTITAQPANATIIEGENTSFSVTATGSAPITYMWEESSDNGSSWSEVASETSNTLSLVSVPIAHNGKQYRCVVNNPAKTPVRSNAATLTVNVTPTAPTITPTTLSLQEGDTGSCAVFLGTGTGKAASVSIVSDNPAVATVDKTDLTTNDTVTVTGVAEGTANINLTWIGGSQDGTTSSVAVDVSKKPIIYHTIIATPDTGGGSYAENAQVVVTAMLNKGYSFTQWTESDTVASTNASYSFVVTADRTLVAKFKADDVVPPKPTTKHTITLGASSDGTFDENSNITVTATPNTGNSFVNWIENSAEVSTNTSYSFGVTADRTLTANFKADDAPEPEPKPAPSYSGRSSDGSVGSSKADVSPNLKSSVTSRTSTKAEATKLFNTALAAKPAGQTTLSFRASNDTSADKTVLAELASLAKKNGVTLTVHFDTLVGKAVTYRISVNPATMQTDLDLTAKIVGGKITMPKFAVPVEIAVKMPAGLTLENLKITQNGKDITETAKPWLDKNGYLHFTTTGGEVLLGK